MNIKIGTKVRLTQSVDNYPTCLIKAGETGTLVRIDSENAYWVKLDAHHPELDEWNNELQIWDWSDYDDNDESSHPEAYLEEVV
jgi:hypothetical protein